MTLDLSTQFEITRHRKAIEQMSQEQLLRYTYNLIGGYFEQAALVRSMAAEFARLGTDPTHIFAPLDPSRFNDPTE